MRVLKYLTTVLGIFSLVGCTLDASLFSDKIAPDAPLALDIDYSVGTLNESPVLTWAEVVDDFSGVARYEVKIVRQKDGVTEAEWKALESGEKISSLSLSQAEAYYAVLRVVDNAGNISPEVTSLPWLAGSDGCIGDMITNTPYAQGTGESSSPYLLCTAAQVAEIANRTQDFDAHFKLLADVNFASVTFDGIGSSATPFKGRFDGGNHLIKNLNMQRAIGDAVGFFNATNFAFIKNFGLDNSVVLALDSENVGSVIGECYYSQLENLTITNLDISGKGYVGGIVGITNACNLLNATVSGTIAGTSLNIGGLVGNVNRGHYFNINATITINASSASSVGGAYGSDYLPAFFQNITINGQINGLDSVGGFTGENWDGAHIYRSSFVGMIKGRKNVGGIAGISGDSPYVIKSTSVNAEITGRTNVGGFTGHVLYNSSYEDSYVAATIFGTGNGQDNFGGFWGNVTYLGTMSRSYANVTINSTANNVGGAAGYTSATGSIVDSFVISDVTGNSVSSSVSSFIGRPDSSAVVGTNSYYLSSASCNNIGGGGCNTLEGIPQANISNFYDPAQAPLSTWDFSNIWVANPSSLPTLNLNRYHTPSVSHNCKTLNMKGLSYSCPVTVTDLDLNELQMVWMQPDNTCDWIYSQSMVLNGSASAISNGECKVSFVVTDGINNSSVQSFSILTIPGVSFSPNLSSSGTISLGSKSVSGGALTKTYTLTNQESESISNLTITGLPNEPFDFAGGTAFPGAGGTCTGSLDAGSSCTVIFSFDPTVSDFFSHDIELQFSTSKGNFKYPFQLSGQGY